MALSPAGEVPPIHAATPRERLLNLAPLKRLLRSRPAGSLLVVPLILIGLSAAVFALDPAALLPWPAGHEACARILFQVALLLLALLALCSTLRRRAMAGKRAATAALDETRCEYRLLLENAGEGIVIAQDRALKRSNPAVTTLSGYTETELLGTPLLQLVHPEDRRMVQRAQDSRIPGKESAAPYDFRLQRKEGGIVWVQGSDIRIRWEGRPATLVFLTDITRRKELERSRAMSEERYRSLLESTTDAVLLVDPESGALVEFNSRAHLNLGYTREAFAKLTPCDFDSRATPESVRKHLSLIARKGFDRHEAEHRTRDGDLRNVIVRSHLVTTD